MSQQNALVLFGPKFQQKTFISQSALYPNGNVPNGGSPRKTDKFKDATKSSRIYLIPVLGIKCALKC
ncbi:unnamed protein product [Lupinus luteus]|uniref:Uncharacterized protein n=1 Tax=Lupinus luteus TaxID=3873 RepID=A0AAV1VWT8_LUPLU